MFHWLVKTVRTYPSSRVSSAELEERRAKKLEQSASESGSGTVATPKQEKEQVSYNILDYLQSRENGLSDRHIVNVESTSRCVLTHNILRENRIELGDIGTVICSKWLSHQQLIIGTRSNKLLVYDLNTRRVDNIPTVIGHAHTEGHWGDQRAIELSPSRSFLATTVGTYSTEMAVYRLPTLEPVYVAEYGHTTKISGMTWLDDHYLVSGSSDSGIVLWGMIDNHHTEPPDIDEEAAAYPDFATIYLINLMKPPLQEISSLCFKKEFKEIAAVSTSGSMHIVNSDTFQLKLSREVPHSQYNTGIVFHSDGLYAVRSEDFTILLDARTLETVKEITLSRREGLFLTTSIEGNILTTGTSEGMVMFYDIRAAKFLESTVDASRPTALMCSPTIAKNRHQDADLRSGRTTLHLAEQLCGRLEINQQRMRLAHFDSNRSPAYVFRQVHRQ
ncbi:DDB1- and CUL4-associated factor 12 homolog [Drosophila takahashii]|uniref:DDB1- and CUL4-associated factor 12 homolog n=1 Tax=Drosophila takahashii TaxID=29030 RepID=UPI0038996D56